MNLAPSEQVHPIKGDYENELLRWIPYRKYSPYEAKWRIPRLTLNACTSTISFNTLNDDNIFLLFLMSFENYMEYSEY